MATVNLLSYGCWAAVIQYLEPNLGISLSQRCPSLRNMIRMFPLKLEKLSFGHHSTVLNDTKYHLGIYTKYDEGVETPKFIQKRNADGSADFDRDPTNPGYLDLREVFLNTRGHVPTDWEIRVQEQRLTKRLRIAEVALKRKTELILMEDVGQLVRDLVGTVEAVEGGAELPEGVLVSDKSPFEPLDFELPRHPIVLNREHPRYHQLVLEEHQNHLAQERPMEDPGNLEKSRQFKSVMNQSLEEIEHIVETARFFSQKSYCKRNGIQLPYTCELQLTITSARGTSVQRLPNGDEILSGGLKALNTKLFGFRSHVIRVKNLRIEDYRGPKYPVSLIVTLPDGVKIQVENLDVSSNSLPPLSQVLLSPVQVLNLRKSYLRHLNLILQNHVLVNTRKLIIHNYEKGNESFVPALRQLRNEYVELEFEGEEFPAEEFMELVQDWQENGRPLGTEFSFGIRSEETILIFLEMIANRLETREIGDNFVVFQMINDLYLVVYYTEIEEKKEFRKRNPEIGPEYANEWTLTMRVEEPSVEMME